MVIVTTQMFLLTVDKELPRRRILVVVLFLLCRQQHSTWLLFGAASISICSCQGWLMLRAHQNGTFMVGVVGLAIVESLGSVLHHVAKAEIVVGTVVCHETDWFILTI